jgi:hypothetical protein
LTRISIHFKSTAACAWTSGCWTLTATTLPSLRVALWTCARDAAPIGSLSKLAKSSST